MIEMKLRRGDFGGHPAILAVSAYVCNFIVGICFVDSGEYRHVQSGSFRNSSGSKA